ncbi:MAG TPA: hypothetical protein VIQ30_00775 [Pseudonocardia sp.]
MTVESEPGQGCPRQPEAGAYLLGALSPGDRADYAAHLHSCEHCLREVGQLAGLPGLLGRGRSDGAQVPGGRAQTLGGYPAPDFRGLSAPGDRSGGPSGVSGTPGALDAALREVGTVQRRRRVLVAAAFVLVAGLGVGATAAFDRFGRPAGPTTGVVAAANLPLHMQPVGNSPVSAAVELTTQPWGTEVVMRCRYAGTAQSPVYILVARSADGTTSELARWSAVTDQDMVLASATELAGSKLAELEVRNAAGTVLLRADRPS